MRVAAAHHGKCSHLRKLSGIGMEQHLIVSNVSTERPAWVTPRITVMTAEEYEAMKLDRVFHPAIGENSGFRVIEVAEAL